MKVIDWYGRGYLSEAIKPLATCPAQQVQLEDRFLANYHGDDGDDDDVFDADDDGYADRKGFSRPVLEKFEAGCANMNIGASLQGKWGGGLSGSALGVGLLWEGLQELQRAVCRREIVSENETIQTRADNKTDIDSREVGRHIKAKIISLSAE